MAKLIYSMLISLDGYIEDERGDFSWATPDAEVFAYVTDHAASFGTYLYGRKMYETMVYWETADNQPDLPQAELAWTRLWQAAEKVVYSKTLTEPRSERTRIERAFDAAAIQQLKATAAKDITVDGPDLAAQAIKAGLVDEIHLIINPVLVGGGKRFFPEGGRLNLTLLEQRAFANGVVVLKYALAN